MRELTLLSQQDGWLPPEDISKKSAWPYFEDDEVLAATAVLRSGKINQWTGKEVENFQNEFAAFCGVRHAIALANGSVALDLALYALDIGPGDEVIVTPRTFVASAGCVALRGAKPVFADVDPESQNITGESIVKVLTPKTRAIIAVHLAGWPCDMDSILEVAQKHNLKVIEDCAQCHGSIYYSRWPGRMPAGEQGDVCITTENQEFCHSREYPNDLKVTRGHECGNPVVSRTSWIPAYAGMTNKCSFSELSQEASMEINGVHLYARPTGSMGDMAAFSFCQDKIMTTGGEGGMLLINDEALWEKAWAYKDHGKSYDAVYHRQHPSGFRWLHESLGTNWRLTEMQAAIGRRQLRKLPDWVAARRRNAAVLTAAFSGMSGLRVTVPPENVRHSYYKYYVFVRPDQLKAGWDRDRIMNEVTALGAPCFSGSCSEVYLEKAFDGNGLRPKERLPVAKELGETSLMFLVHPTLTEADMRRVADIVGKVMAEATK